MEEKKCPFCQGKGAVGGLYDGAEYIPIEDCVFCDGMGVLYTNEEKH